MVITPLPDGIISPTLTSAEPEMLNPVDPPADPIGSGYGAPDSEFTIWQMLPTVARGMPFAVTHVCVITVMTPVSGGPAAPGLTITVQPMLTGDPGMISFSMTD
jgi:hypothetical protein